MPRIPKDTKVIYRKLGREKAYGIAHIGNNKIEIDPAVSKRKFIEILLHELLHIHNPEFSETKVLKQSKAMTKVLWENNIRWTDL